MAFPTIRNIHLPATVPMAYNSTLRQQPQDRKTKNREVGEKCYVRSGSLCTGRTRTVPSCQIARQPSLHRQPTAETKAVSLMELYRLYCGVSIIILGVNQKRSIPLASIWRCPHRGGIPIYDFIRYNVGIILFSKKDNDAKSNTTGFRVVRKRMQLLPSHFGDVWRDSRTRP